MTAAAFTFLSLTSCSGCGELMESRGRCQRPDPLTGEPCGQLAWTHIADGVRRNLVAIVACTAERCGGGHVKAEVTT